MSAVYLGLAKLPNTSANYALPFEPTTAGVDSWMRKLPASDPDEVRQALLEVLQALASSNFSPKLRTRMLSQMRQLISRCAMVTLRQYRNKPLPLSADLHGLAADLVHMYALLGENYRLAAAQWCAPEGRVSWLRSRSVRNALARAVENYANAQAESWRVYQTAPAGVLDGLQLCAQFAIEVGLGDQALASGLDLRARYVQSMLVAQLSPMNFNRDEQILVWEITGAMAPACTLMRQADGLHSIDLASLGESAITDSLHWKYLNADPFLNAISEALQAEQQDVEPDQPVLKTANTTLGPSSVALLRKLRAGLLKKSERHYSRLQGGNTVATALGLIGAHFYAAGEQGFAQFARELIKIYSLEHDTQMLTDLAAALYRPGRFIAQVIDHSLSGYCLQWASAKDLSIRTGGLVAIDLDDDGSQSTWLLSVVRWIRYLEDGRVLAGVELLSRQAYPVALLQNGDAAYRALEIRLIDGEADWHYLVQGELSVDTEFTLLRSPDIFDSPLARASVEKITKLQDIERLGDYHLYRRPSAKAVAEPEL